MKLSNAQILQRLKASLGLDPIDSKIIVVGAGVTGISIARFLMVTGFNFVMADSRLQKEDLTGYGANFSSIEILSGRFDPAEFCSASHLIVSPGIALTEEAIAVACAGGTQIVGDIDLFVCATDSPIIAITGSNGKSTVTTLLGEMARTDGRKVGVGGNLGEPALDLLQTNSDHYILELSSFQLERTQLLNALVATVLNVTADHMDRHKNLADYAAQKQKVFAGNGVMIINEDDPIVVAMKDINRKTITFSIANKADFYLENCKDVEYLMHHNDALIPLSEIPLEGRHNAANVLAALALGYACGLSEQAMCNAIKSFKGLDHRMQRVTELDGIVWVNDSKATNIGACVAALEGYSQKVILIAGGDAKGADMTELMPTVQEKTKSVVVMGKDADLIEQAIAGNVPVYKAASMQEAVLIAEKLAVAGDCVLLSPACASLDQYKNYQDRGNQFVAAVMTLVKQSSPIVAGKMEANL